MRYDIQKGWFYNQHSCFLLQYHLIFVTKYRHPVLTGEVKEFVYSYLKEKMEAYGLNVMAMSGEPDHVHILFEAPPNALCGLIYSQVDLLLSYSSISFKILYHIFIKIGS